MRLLRTLDDQLLYYNFSFSIGEEVNWSGFITYYGNRYYPLEFYHGKIKLERGHLDDLGQCLEIKNRLYKRAEKLMWLQKHT